MKNLLTLLALFFGLGLGSAQDKKPTLDETVKYINDILTVSNGVFGRSNDKTGYAIITEQKFLLQDYYSSEDMFVDSKRIFQRTTQRSNIDWSSLVSIVIDDKEDLKELTLRFNTPFNITYTSETGDNTMGGNKQTGKIILIYVIPEKVENVKKALLRLKELTYKKDPFE
ncbi:hypothetical protein EIB75_10050 [Epilithonimonas vandammei]|uniref:DUF4252 domain-containing protein n=1 Tax=Epilithonimonas vandammei TaxID=2487072 RepID=A0A3G8ZDW6_9FLAO|nr:hypothetical protein [Epilithonimonas vandammei]AZI55569.1 hypothetical protein EIB75_10050 [Epilithonimonas vandammei]